MHDAALSADRDQVILGELAELGLELAYRVQQRAMAAEDEVLARLTRAFHVAGRTVRQSLALKAKLAADRVRLGREAQAAERAETARRVARRAEQVRAAVRALIWTEAERPDAAELERDLDDLVEVDSTADDFLTAPIATQVARIAHDLGLSARLAAADDVGGDDDHDNDGDGEDRAPPRPDAVWDSG